MGLGPLPDSSTVAAGLLILAQDILKITAALQGALVGRNTSGVATPGQSLGTLLLPWGPAYITSLILDGDAIDLSGIVSPANRIVSGLTRATSGQPQFIVPDGAATQFVLEGLVTNLILSIDSVTATVDTNITESGLTEAPSSNNTCAINDNSFADQAASKYFGEIDSEKPTINIDTVGSEISSRVGQMISLQTSGGEIMWGWLKSATKFVDVKRGYFFDDNGDPIVRETLADDDVLTLMETGWVFVENDGLTVDVTYLTPVYSFTSPTPGTLSQYWYDLENQTWKRDNGSSFVQINRVPVGLAVIDDTDCIAARSFDFYQDFKPDNTIDLEIFSDEIIRAKAVDNFIEIYGTRVQIPYSVIDWDNTADMETGSVAADTTYYLYLSTDGERFISVERPYDRIGDLRGNYHPYNNWRAIGEATTDSSSDWATVTSYYLKPVVDYIDDNVIPLIPVVTGKSVAVNGDFEVAQMGTNFPAIADGDYSIDMYEYNKVGAMVHTVSQDTDVPTQAESGFKSNYSLKVDCTTIDGAIAAADLCTITQKIEGVNYKQFERNTGTCSFWVKGTKTGIHCVAFRNSVNDRSYVVEYTINLTNTWEFKEIPVVFDYSGGTWNYTNGIGLSISWVLAAGSNFQGVADTWNSANNLVTSNQVNACDNTANNFRVAQFQFELGAVANDFDNIKIGQTERDCYRHYWRSKGSTSDLVGSGRVANATTVDMFFPLPVEMRTTPSIGRSAANDFNVESTAGSIVTTVIGDAGKGSRSILSIAANVAGGLTGGESAQLIMNGANKYIEAIARL